MKAVKSHTPHKIVFASAFFVFLILPILLVYLWIHSSMGSFMQERLETNLQGLFDSLTSYLSLGFTLLLGIIVYYQSQKINDLTSSQYEIFIGATDLDYSHTLSNILIEEPSTLSDFSIKRSSIDGRRNFFTHLNTTFQEKQQPIFIPLSFITKNQPIIVSLAFQDISFALVSQDRQVKNQIFHSQGEKIYCMFEDNTNFLLGIGMMIPNAIKIDEIKLELCVNATDQIGRTTKFKIAVRLKNVEKQLHLVSSQTSYAA